MSELALRSVSVRLGGSEIVREVGVTVEAGGWLGLIGPNGAGKTTLLRAVAGLSPYVGAIALGGDEISSLDRRSLARCVAYVAQAPVTPEEMTVSEYVLLGRTPHLAPLGRERSVDLDVTGDVLVRLELEPFAERRLGSLSGGERQRAVLGRALVQEAPLLLLDEPTSSLDLGHQQHVLELVDEARRTRELTVVSAMHDLTLAAQYVESLLFLRAGSVVAAGAARDVLTRDALRSHYGASVDVLEHPDSGVVVVPIRDRG